jgi:hypothetical protein
MASYRKGFRLFVNVHQRAIRRTMRVLFRYLQRAEMRGVNGMSITLESLWL